MKNVIAYSGKIFTIEWYFDARGKSASLEYFEALTTDEKIKVLYLFQAMGDFGKIRNEQKFRYEGDQLYAFKPKPHRFLSFFFTGSKIIITNAFEKKADKLPTGEKTKALNYRKDYEERVRKGLYYDNKEKDRKKK